MKVLKYIFITFMQLLNLIVILTVIDIFMEGVEFWIKFIVGLALIVSARISNHYDKISPNV